MKPRNQKSTTWCFLDCVQMQRYDVVDFPSSIGTVGHCNINVGANGTVGLLKPSPVSTVKLNGVPMADHHPLTPGVDYSLLIDGSMYLLRGDADIDSWIKQLNLSRWVLQDVFLGELIGQISYNEMGDFAQRMGLDGDSVITAVEGATQGFYLSDVLPPSAEATAPSEDSRNEQIPDYDSEPPAEEVTINKVSGEFNCPHCWEHFDRGDVMWVAKHPDLRDPDLGDEFPLRFFPTIFDERGRAVDGRGVSCSEMACPNCKSKLPPQYLDLKTQIFSVVGAPSAGKSYFLTSMINQLEEKLPYYFSLSFQDGDAAGNAMLSDMRAKLFSDSSKPENLYLGKTQEGGNMFKKWTVNGREVELPKPFTYLISPFAGNVTEDNSKLLVFYDNAGEQFEPAERSEADLYSHVDTTKYLASSDTIFYLYDPATNVRFRRMIKEKDDPQLAEGEYMRFDRQDNIIAEMRNRIKTELFLDAKEKIKTPLAMLIGKCDLWTQLLPEPIIDPMGEGKLDLNAIETNSQNIREFLMKTSPGVVGAAESISHTVRYFPVSSFGHSPQPFIDPHPDDQGNEIERIGPVPGKVTPLYPEIPVLWSLANLHPELFSQQT